MWYLLGESSSARVFGAVIFAPCTQAQFQPHTCAHILNWKKDMFISQHWEHGQWWKIKTASFFYPLGGSQITTPNVGPMAFEAKTFLFSPVWISNNDFQRCGPFVRLISKVVCHDVGAFRGRSFEIKCFAWRNMWSQTNHDFEICDFCNFGNLHFGRKSITSRPDRYAR